MRLRHGELYDLWNPGGREEEGRRKEEGGGRKREEGMEREMMTVHFVGMVRARRRRGK